MVINNFRMFIRASPNSISFREIIALSTRAVSSKYPRPTPRPYKRRLFEEALSPVLPSTLKSCTPPGLVRRQKLETLKEYDEIELALCNMVKKWIIKEDFRVLVVCQFLPVQGRTLRLAKNQLHLKGVEFRNYGNKIMHKIFAGTPISSLNVTLVGSNAFLFGKDLATIKTIVSETDKLNWIVPLVFMVDSRVLSVADARRLSELQTLDDLRAETVKILSTQLYQLPLNLNSQASQLTAVLSHISTRSTV